MNKIPPNHTIKAELCRRSFYFFIRTFWDTVVQEDPIWNWHIEYLADELQKVAERVIERKPKKHDLIINVPPSSSKSTICTIMFPVWSWIKDPTLKFITASFSMSLSINHSVYSRDIIRSDKFGQMFPEIQIKDDKDGKSEYENTESGVRIATSVGSNITGRHGHLLVIDDPIDPEKAYSQVRRDTANRWMSQTLTTRKVDKRITPLILIQQRLNQEDCTGYLLKNSSDKIKHICLPAEETSNIKPPELKKKYKKGLLDPMRMPQDILDIEKVALSSYGYSGQYLQTPSPEGGGLIKPKWFPIIDRNEVPDNLVRYFYSDTSEGKKTSDNMATLCWSLWEGKMIVWEVQVWKKPFNEFIGYRDQTGTYINKAYDNFVLKHNQNGQSAHFFEAKSTGTPYIQYVNAHTSYSAIEDMPKGSKIDRVGVSQNRIEAGRIVLVEGDWIDSFLEECRAFTGKDGDPDDRVDVLTGAIKMTEFKGSSFIDDEKSGEKLEDDTF